MGLRLGVDDNEMRLWTCRHQAPAMNQAKTKAPPFRRASQLQHGGGGSGGRGGAPGIARAGTRDRLQSSPVAVRHRA